MHNRKHLGVYKFEFQVKTFICREIGRVTIKFYARYLTMLVTVYSILFSVLQNIVENAKSFHS